MGTNIAELRGKVRQFVERHAIPSEDPALAHDVQRLDVVVRRLQGLAREAGIYAPHLPPGHGGLGLDWQARAEILEEAGRSFLGAPALNCAPPDSRT